MPRLLEKRQLRDWDAISAPDDFQGRPEMEGSLQRFPGHFPGPSHTIRFTPSAGPETLAPSPASAAR